MAARAVQAVLRKRADLIMRMGLKHRLSFSMFVCIALQLFVFLIVCPPAGTVHASVFLLACCFLSVSGFLLLLVSFPLKTVDIAINKVQFKGGKIDSGTLGFSFGVLQGHPLCNVLRN